MAPYLKSFSMPHLTSQEFGDSQSEQFHQNLLLSHSAAIFQEAINVLKPIL